MKIWWTCRRLQKKKNDNGTRHLLTVIDLFGPYPWWVVPLQNKTGALVRDAFRSIVTSSKRSPRKLWVNEGKEFYNATVKQWLADNGISMYSTHNDGKGRWLQSDSTERSNTLQQNQQMSTSKCYPKSKLVHEYNTSKHRTAVLV